MAGFYAAPRRHQGAAPLADFATVLNIPERDGRGAQRRRPVLTDDNFASIVNGFEKGRIAHGKGAR